MVDRLVVSPHLDDAALSLGGSIHSWTKRGESVLVLTIFAGVESTGAVGPLLKRQLRMWGIAHYAERRDEDVAALKILRADYLHGDAPELLLRNASARTIDELMGTIEPTEIEADIIADISRVILAAAGRARVIYVPCWTSRHPDHVLVARAVARTGVPHVTYEEMPYALDDALPIDRSIFDDEDMRTKIDAVASYTSQLSALFGGHREMVVSLTRRARQLGGPSAFGEGILGDGSERGPSGVTD